MRIVTTAIALCLAASCASAQDPSAFEEGSEAKSWNLYGEYPAFFAARVVDVLCEIADDCPADCGGGSRQLGLIREADGVLVLPNKNAQPAFNGATAELQPFCGMDVEVDGLLLDDPDLGATNIYLVQKIRAKGDTEWTAATRWTDVWAERNPGTAGEGPWFRRDPRIAAEIAEEGYFGLGADRDADIKAEVFK